MNDILEKLIEYNKAYREGNPIVPDSVYDELLEKLPIEHPYRNSVEEEPLYKNRIKHSVPMLSMQKCKTDKELNFWFAKVIESARKIGISASDILIRTNAKLDGIACVKFEKNNGYAFATRGDGIHGNDITTIMNKGVVVKEPDVNNKRVLGELVVDLKYFNQNLKGSSIDGKFSNARNFVSGAAMADTLNSKTREAFDNDAIVFQSYATLPTFLSSISSTMEEIRDYEKAIWKNANYLIDGVIIDVANEEIREAMGCTESYPNYSMALKPKDKKYISKVIDIVWQTGRTGKVCPVVIMDPINIDGAMVGRASGHNAKMIVDMGIEIGKEIEVVRSGSVIPYIVGVL